METFVIEYSCGDGCTYGYTERICVEAESKEELYCAMVDFRTNRKIAHEEYEKIRKANYEKFIVRNKKYADFANAMLDVPNPYGMKNVLHGYDITAASLSDWEGEIEESSIYTLQEWANKMLNEQISH